MLIKKDALEIFTNHKGKTPMLKSLLFKTTSPQARSFIKKRSQHRHPSPHPPAPTRAKTRGITLNWKITNPDQFGIIKVFGDKEGKSALMHNTWHKAVRYN